MRAAGIKLPSGGKPKVGEAVSAIFNFYGIRYSIFGIKYFRAHYFWKTPPLSP